MASEASGQPYGRVLARLARETERALAPLELTLSQYRVLLVLSAGEEGASSLAAKLGISNASVTGVVHVLVNREFVDRRHSSEDRRCVQHKITLNGLQVLERADAAIERRLRDFASRWSERGEELFLGLDVWSEAFKNHDSALIADASAIRGRA